MREIQLRDDWEGYNVIVKVPMVRFRLRMLDFDRKDSNEVLYLVIVSFESGYRSPKSRSHNLTRQHPRLQ